MEGSSCQPKGLESWRRLPIQQQPLWPDLPALDNAVNTIRSLPPLVSAVEVLKLRQDLAAVAEGKGFILQGGDCAERFLDCNATTIETKIRLLLQMSGVIGHSTGEPCTIIARIAGQYGKPRSSCPKTEDVRKVFRGDNIHGYEVEERRPDPQRLIRGYFTSSATLNYIRSLLRDGFDDIVHFPSTWDLDFVKTNENMSLHHDILERVTEETFRLHKLQEEKTKAVINISHEAILLDYEDAMTREFEGKNYNLSAPFVWIGDRTRQLDHAHVEYVRHIENPIGIKVGPSMEAAELIELLKLVWPNPEKTPGKVTLITRYGVPNVERCLSKHIEAVKSAGYKVVWVCDPCHGNTQVSKLNGYKTRDFQHVWEELRLCIKTHRALGSRLGGVHLEMTGEDVTECIGGSENLTEADLPLRFESYCDPRLNYTQSMEMSLRLAKLLLEGQAGLEMTRVNNKGQGKWNSLLKNELWKTEAPLTATA